MATLQIKVKNSRFVESNGVNIQEFSPTYVEGNQWKCQIEPDGTIYCNTESIVNGILYSLRFSIKRGWTKLTLKIGEERPKVLRNCKLRDSKVEGIIGLPSGPITSKRAYFREAAFQQLLDRYGLTAVRFEQADGIYALYEQFKDGESIFKEKIESTDGNRELIYECITTSEEGETLVIEQHVQITGARWAIKTVQKADGGFHRILITTENPKTMRGLPRKPLN